MFDLNIRFLKLTGLWCILNKSGNSVKSLIHLLCFLLLAQIIYLPAELVKLLSFSENFEQTMEQLGFMLTHILGTVKIISLYISRKKLSKIMDDLRRYSYIYDCDVHNNCHSLEEAFNRKAYRVCAFFFLMGSCAGLLKFLITTIHLIYCKEDTTDKELCITVKPFFIPIPVFLNTIPGRWILGGFQCVCLTLYAWQIVAYDTLFATFLIYIDCSVHILRYFFETITERSMNKLQLRSCITSNPELTRHMNMQMRTGTINLQNLIMTCVEIADVFKYVILLQVLFALFILMTCLYVAASVPLFGASFTFQLEFYLTIVTQLSLYCWFGNEITLSFRKIPDAMYNNNWIPGDKSFKGSMLLNTLRMNKPIHIMIGMVTPLNLNVLIYILRASYSYFAVIKSKY
uniref:Odorant receptor n=1 Tax=Holotrichia parallela TaxID=93412 RepID=A0A2P9JY57_HOLPA|nr:odorant receptor 18 [Holotrichia parallela]